MRARLALGKIYCGRQGCRGELPSPDLVERTRRLRPPIDGRLRFALAGWWLRDGVEHRGGRRRGDRFVQRGRHNTKIEAGGQARLWSSDGVRTKALPFEAECPRCQTINIIDAELVAGVG